MARAFLYLRHAFFGMMSAMFRGISPGCEQQQQGRMQLFKFLLIIYLGVAMGIVDILCGPLHKV